MSFADASSTRLAYIAETAFGVTPTTPAFKVLRYTGEALRYEKQTVQSDEIRSDRNVADLIQVGRRATGSVNFELSYATLDDFLEGVLFSSWSTNVLKNGTTRKSFTFEKTFETGVTDVYTRYRGCVIGGMSLDLSAQQIVRGSVNVTGLGGSVDTAILTDATYTAANTNPVLNTSSHFSDLTVTGSPRIRTLTLNIQNNLREQPEIGNIDLAGVAADRCVISGSIGIYFENEAMYQSMLDHDTLSLSFDLGAASGSKYTFDIPAFKVGAADPVAGGNGQDVMLNADWTAIYDSGIGASIRITRGVV